MGLDLFKVGFEFYLFITKMFSVCSCIVYLPVLLRQGKIMM